MPPHSATDLEVTGFYIESAWTNGTLTVLHIYSSDGDISKGPVLWHQLQGLGEAYRIAPGVQVSRLNELTVSSQFVVDEAVQQLTTYLQLPIPYPLASFSSGFGVEVQGNDGMHFWRGGVVPDDVRNAIIKPVDTEDIFIAQSSYSQFQQWQFGGIDAALQNLEQNFAIDDLLQNEQECVWNRS